MADVRSKKEVVRAVRDTVYVAVRDSILVKSEEFLLCKRAELERRVKSSISHHTSAISHLLKWVLAVICAVGVLIITIKVKDERRMRSEE